jgi:hypothetical protein
MSTTTTIEDITALSDALAASIKLGIRTPVYASDREHADNLIRVIGTIDGVAGVSIHEAIPGYYQGILVFVNGFIGDRPFEVIVIRRRE